MWDCFCLVSLMPPPLFLTLRFHSCLCSNLTRTSGAQEHILSLLSMLLADSFFTHLSLYVVVNAWLCVYCYHITKERRLPGEVV